MANYDADEDERTGYDHTSPDPQAQLLREKMDMMNPKRVQRDNFLDAISQIESSGGQNTNHPMIQNGLQAGQQAIGSYGLLPNTVQELSNRARLKGQLTPEMSAASRNPASIGNDPQLEKQYANQLADKVLNKYQDPDMAAYAWNHGHNIPIEEIKQRHIEDDPYVQKFKQIRKSLGYK